MFVSIISTKIPFKGAGKEYIGDDVEEMVAAVKQAIQQCGLQLKVRSSSTSSKLLADQLLPAKMRKMLVIFVCNLQIR